MEARWAEVSVQKIKRTTLSKAQGGFFFLDLKSIANSVSTSDVRDTLRMDPSIKSLNNRSLLVRGRRRLLAKLRSLCLLGLELTEDTRVLRAWRKGWESNHYLRLLRWRDEGFFPKCIYDIGANTGEWTEMCQELFAPEQCYLFEPQLALRPEISKHKAKTGGEWKIFDCAR
jgi:hypothetical protein